MSNYNVNSINSYNNINTNYSNSNNTIKTNSPSGLFDNILGNVANVPTGRQSRYNNYNTSQTCAIHGKSSSTYNTLSSSVSNTSSRDVQTKKAIEIANLILVANMYGVLQVLMLLTVLDLLNTYTKKLMEKIFLEFLTNKLNTVKKLKRKIYNLEI